ncbi:hypothetical protein SAMN05421830_12216 [Desulfomicrobium norvegicum]|uniref:Uncharacterized protein n=1 Tax=Desulfomicrobium norvegicum (strain DSM 1741 / NCIMB 8310) TaxID=52561 RepID=A0A8G2F671_DESNO|nr:hypothetical protein [Desulfomicrobium norvegicum]SFM21947.1 hypothetical protein SAMN05421830_12216 [Desulfomicrobium norvegicum]
MKKKYDSASGITINQLRNYQETLEKAIKLCEKHKNSYFFGGYSTKDRTWHEDKNSMESKFVVYTLGELEIYIQTTYSCAHTYFSSEFHLNDERRDLRIARKALRIITDQINTKIELGIE